MGITIQQGLTAGSGGNSMTLLGTLTTTSGATQSLTGIAAGYRQLYCEFEGVSGTSTDALTVALSSTNGAAYGTAANLVATTGTAAADVYAGTYTIGNISSTTAAAKSGYGSLLRNGVTNNNNPVNVATPTNTAAVADAIRFGWSAAATFDAGTIRIYGVK